MTTTTTGTTCMNFDDELHQLLNTPRPKTEDQRAAIVATIENLAETCAGDEEKWKRLILSVFHKRYHIRAPEAKAANSGSSKNHKTQSESKKQEATATGDGERKIFYLAVKSLFQKALREEEETQATTSSSSSSLSRTSTYKALQVVLNMAPLVGGSRDVCTLLEDCVGVLIQSSVVVTQKRNSMHQLHQKESLGLLVATAIQECLVLFSTSQVCRLIDTHLLQIACADVLAVDLEIVRRRRNDENNDANTDPLLPSTLHIFLPHRDRGAPASSGKKRKKSDNPAAVVTSVIIPLRQLVNCVVEILIWSRVPAAMGQDAFAKSYENLILRTAAVDDDLREQSIKKAMHVLQTITRKLRQEINRYARSQGFMLANQFDLKGPSGLDIDMICRGKEGDITLLARKATKASSVKVLNMIQTRFTTNLNKVVKFSSVGELVSSWNATTTTNNNNDGDKVVALQREFLVARLKATVAYLSKVMMTGDDHETLIKNGERSVVVASLAVDQQCNIATVLTAAALLMANNHNWEKDEVETTATDHRPQQSQSAAPVMEITTTTNNTTTATKKNNTAAAAAVKLFMGGKQRHMDSFDACVILVDEIMSNFKADEQMSVPTMMTTTAATRTAAEEDDNGNNNNNRQVATTKAILNLLERHVGGANGDNNNNKETLIFFSNAVLELPQDVRRDLIDRGCRVHCHDIDDMGKRLTRQKAEKGDITISLAWDTGDDLDLHVILPSGEEIYYGNRRSTKNDNNRDNSPCCLDVDMNAGRVQSIEPVENVFCGKLDQQKEAPKGQYKVVVQNFAYHASKIGSSIPWRIVVEKNDTKERFFGECKGTGKDSNVVACTFNYLGREVPWNKRRDGAADGDPDAFAKANLVNITTSTGQTIESLSNLVTILKDQEQLDQVRVLDDVEPTTTNNSDEERRPSEAPKGRLEVTSRDRLSVLLFKLPDRFHRAVNEAFGGTSLAEVCAQEVAARMVLDKIPLSELKRHGYPSDIIDAVKRNLLQTPPAAPPVVP